MTLAEGLTSSNAIRIEMVYYVYALWSESYDKIYVGMSTSPDRRLRDHNAGRSQYTKKYLPWIRFYLEEVTDKSEARKKEKYLKSGWGRRKLKLELEEWQSGRMRRS